MVAEKLGEETRLETTKTDETDPPTNPLKKQDYSAEKQWVAPIISISTQQVIEFDGPSPKPLAGPPQEPPSVWNLCPYCESTVVSIKCKLVCPNCHNIVQGCCE